jgi:hypothetical protein
MRKGLLAVWVLLPVGAWAYHEGPGQDALALDDAAALLEKAHAAALEGDWAVAVESYGEALASLPAERQAELRRIRLERAKAQMLAHQLPAAHADLAALVSELQGDRNADVGVLAAARDALAQAQYYMTWLMRLEGRPREDWEPEIDGARQLYALLAEQAEAAGDEQAAARARADLESAVRLARMELKDLQGLPIPSQ